MATKTVTSGQTFALHGTLGVGHTLVADSGSPAYLAGGYVAVHTSALNQGTIDLLAGPSYRNVGGVTGATLRATGLLTNGGLIEAAGGTDASGRRGAVGGGAVEIAHTGSITNTGTIVLDGAGAFNSSHHDGTTTGALLRDNGSLTNNGSLLIHGSYVGGHGSSATVVVAGVLTNARIIEVGSGAARYKRDYGSSGARGGVFRLLSTGTIVNNGNFEVGPSNVYTKYIRPLGAATLQIAGQFTNNGTLGLYIGNARYSQGSQVIITGTGTLLNQDVLKLSGGGDSFTNYSGFSSTPATLTNDGVLTNHGLIDIQSGGNDLIDNGVLTNDGTVDIDGCFRNYNSYNGFGTLNVAGTLTNAGTMQIGAGNNDGYRNYDAFGAIVSDIGTIDNTGTITLEGGTFQESSVGGGATLIDVGVLTNTGQIILNSFGGYRGFGAAALLEVSGTLTNDGAISIGLNSYYPGYSSGVGTMSVSGLLENTGTVNGNGVLINTGTIASGGSGVTSGVITSTTLENSGSIEVAPSGAFLIDSNISAVHYHVGDLFIDAHATLTLGGSVGFGQTVDFAGTQSVLALAAPTAFYATIEGLRPGTTIDFLKTGISAAVASGATLDLTLIAGGALDLTLAAPLAADDMLGLQSDQHGGTDLTVGQTPAASAVSSGSYGLTGYNASGPHAGSAGVLTVHLPL